MKSRQQKLNNHKKITRHVLIVCLHTKTYKHKKLLALCCLIKNIFFLFLGSVEFRLRNQRDSF